MRGNAFSPQRQLIDVTGDVASGQYDNGLGVRTGSQLTRLAWGHRHFRGFAAVGDGTAAIDSATGAIVAKKFDWSGYAPWGLVALGAAMGVGAIASKKPATKKMLGYGSLAAAAGGFLWVFLAGKPAFHPTDSVVVPPPAPDGTVSSPTSQVPMSAGDTSTGAGTSDSTQGPPLSAGQTALTRDAGL